MSVLVEAISVIVRISTLRDKYPSGVDAYRALCPNRTYCADEPLTRIGFMVPDDVRGFVKILERGRHAEGFAAVWLAGTEPGEFVAPEGWTIGQSQRMNRCALEDVAETMFPIGNDDGLDVVLDLKTGQERYIGRVHWEPDSHERSAR